MSESKLDEILRTRRFPGLSGLSDGPGSCNNELVFDRPDPAKDIPLTLKKMEADGKLNTPESIKAAKIKLEESKKMINSGIDYQKGGHPLDT